MGGRVLTLAVVVAAAVLAPPDRASAQATNMTLDQAAATVPFPVWRPARTLGLKQRLTGAGTCSDGSRQYVYANWQKGQRLLSLSEGRSLCYSPNDGAVPVKTVRIHGVRARVSMICEHGPCGAHVPAGVGRGYHVLFRLPARRSPNTNEARRTRVLASGFRIRLPRLLRILRSLRPVDLTRPTVQLDHFLSSDRTAWCFMSGTARKCVAFTGVVQYGGQVNRDGDVTLCDGTPPADPCVQQYDPSAPQLADGQVSDYGGYVCVDQSGAVTCTVKTGAGKDHGFRASTTGSEEIVP